MCRSYLCVNLQICSSRCRIGSHGLQRRTKDASGIQSLGNSPGHYNMQATARATGSYPSHRPGAAHLKTPETATAIRSYVGQRMVVDKGAATITTSQGELCEPCKWPGQKAGTAAHITKSEGVGSRVGNCNVENLCLSTLSRTRRKPLSH